MQILTGILVLIVAAFLVRLLVSRDENVSPGGGQPGAGHPTDDSVREFLLRGRKIEAIKAYREVHGVGLKDAKTAVEALARKLPPSGS